MKHTGLKRLFSLVLIMGLVCALIPAQALTLGDMPDPVALNADAEAPSFQMAGLGGTIIDSSELDGKVAILLFGRVTCGNCHYFMSCIKDVLPLLQEQGISFLVGLSDNPSDQKVQEFSDLYGSCRCGKISNYIDNGMWNGLEAVGHALGSITFPVIFIRDKNNHLRYYSTGPYRSSEKVRSVASVALELTGVQLEPTRPTTIDLNLSADVIGMGETVTATYKVNNPRTNGRIVYRIEVMGSNGMGYTEVDYEPTGSLPAEGTIQYTMDNPYTQNVNIFIDQLVDGKIFGHAQARVLNRYPAQMDLQFTVADPPAQCVPGGTCRFDSEVSGTKGFGTAEIEWTVDMVNYNGKQDDETAWTVRHVSTKDLTDVTDGSQWYEAKIPYDAQAGEVARVTFTFTCGGWTKIIVKECAVAGGASVDMENIQKFVIRCYEIILGRGVDPTGLNDWSNLLATGQAQASQIIDGIVSSEEFKLRGLTNEQKVEVLYKAMLDRGSDPAGKAEWLEALNSGAPYGKVINGFCGSIEFKALCDKYGIQPGSVDVGPIQPVTPGADMENIQKFVIRCYEIILGRGVDPTGLNDWSNLLATGQAQASQIIDGIVSSEEFKLRGLTNEQKVEVLYKAMLDRGSDPDGKAAWLKALNEGAPYAKIINGFCGSNEFKALCDKYGIQPGSVQVKAALVKRVSITPEGFDAEASAAYIAYSSEFVNQEKIRAFVQHCYESVLGREGDEEGIANYTALIMGGKKTPKRVAYEFIFSPEFQGKLPGNEELVRILYKLYLNRDPGAEELAGWIEMLEGGAGLEEVVKGFAESAEFRTIMREMKE